MVPVLPPEQLEEIYDHILQEEIQARGLDLRVLERRGKAEGGACLGGRKGLSLFLGVRLCTDSSQGTLLGSGTACPALQEEIG